MTDADHADSFELAGPAESPGCVDRSATEVEGDEGDVDDESGAASASESRLVESPVATGAESIPSPFGRFRTGHCTCPVILLDDLTRREKKAVFADSAYSDKKRRVHLRRRGVLVGIIYKRTRGQEQLYVWQERWNRLVSRIRAKVEQPLGMMKQQFGYRRVWYCGQDRNVFDFCIMVIAANVKRRLSLAES